MRIDGAKEDLWKSVITSRVLCCSYQRLDIKGFHVVTDHAKHLAIEWFHWLDVDCKGGRNWKITVELSRSCGQRRHTFERLGNNLLFPSGGINTMPQDIKNQHGLPIFFTMSLCPVAQMFIGVS
jgi:hypothetical protein